VSSQANAGGSVQAQPPLPDRLNQECFCITVDQERLRRALEQGTRDRQVSALISARPHLFSSTPVFLAADEMAKMLRIVRAVEAATALPAYRDAVLSWAPEIARHDPGPLGVFMGYDFHLTVDGPKLIEINSNAGGAFLNTLLVRAQRTCCAEVDLALGQSGVGEFEAAVSAMFASEWRLQRGSGKPERIAVVDDQPQDQYLYPEFLLAQRFFESEGAAACVADATQLRYENDRLLVDGRPVDLVYNRLVDFALDRPEHAALRAAYLAGAVVVTPHPRVHALFADKRNLTVLCDRAALRSWGLSPEPLADLEAIPRTVAVTAANAEQLWQGRRRLYFKPATGHGGKAVYGGEKVTKGVWADITRGGYVAQEFAAPSKRIIQLDGVQETRKADVRLYVYRDQLLLTAARLYRGQTTNFRTPGGGFAPLLAL